MQVQALDTHCPTCLATFFAFSASIFLVNHFDLSPTIGALWFICWLNYHALHFLVMQHHFAHLRSSKSSKISNQPAFSRNIFFHKSKSKSESSRVSSSCLPKRKHNTPGPKRRQRATWQTNERTTGLRHDDLVVSRHPSETYGGWSVGMMKIIP